MLHLKEANMKDIEKEYEFITNTPEDENGFTNSGFGCSREDFENKILPDYINSAKGVGLPEGWVPETELFLWDDDKIVGVFRIRPVSYTHLDVYKRQVLDGCKNDHSRKYDYRRADQSVQLLYEYYDEPDDDLHDLCYDDLEHGERKAYRGGAE